MTVNLGTVRPGSTLVIPFSTYSSDDPAKSITTTELDVGAITVFKDGSLTQRASTSGEGVDIDVDAIVGTHWITIDLSDNDTAGFYAAGSRYVVILQGLVIDAATAMSNAVATFDIGYPNAIINTTCATVASQTSFTLTAGPAEADVLIGCKLLFHDVASAVQVAYAYVTDYAATTKTVTCTDPVGFTFVATDNVSVFLPDNVHAVQGTTQTAGDVPALIATAQSDLDIITDSDGVILGAAGVDLVWDEVLTGATHNVASSAGRRLRQLETGFVLDSGTADAGAANTIDLETGVAVATDDFYNHNVAVITGGTGVGQARVISDYVGSTAQATVTPAWVTNPDATSTYDIIPGVVHSETIGGGYNNGAVWVDTAGGTAGTQLYVNGTVDNPVDSIADAKTIADALNMRIFHILPGSGITLAATYDDYEILGFDYTLALGGQSVNKTLIQGSSSVSGTFTGNPSFAFCEIGSITGPSAELVQCGFAATITANATGDWFVNQCYSKIAGASTPIFDFGTDVGSSSNVSFGSYSNGIEFRNYNNQGTDLLSLSGEGQVVYAASSASGTVQQRGDWKVTNTGGVTIASDDNTTNIAAILVDTGTTLDGKINTIDSNVDAILLDTAEIGTAGAGLTDLGGMSTAMKAEVNAEADTALTDYDPPTNTEMEARTLVAASYFDPAADTVATVTTVTNQLTAGDVADGVWDEATSGHTTQGTYGEPFSLEIPGTASGTPTTTTMVSDITVSVDDQFKGRVIIFTPGTTSTNLQRQATDITGCTASTNTLTFTALTNAPVSGDTFEII